MTKEIFMHPIRDFRPIIRFSDIKTWFSTRQQNIIQGIRKIGNNHKKVINLEDSLEKTNEKYLQLQDQQIEIKHEINNLQKTLDKQNKRLEEVVWLLKTQFEYLEENTVDQLLEIKQREKVLDSDIKKRLKIMKKEFHIIAELIQKTGKDVLYQITRANERLTTGSLTLIGVSNDLTFKERLDPRVISTLSEEEIIFTNYNLPQIREILDARIEVAFDQGVISDAALNLCSAMAGRESGDARRALDLLRVAAEIAERSQVPTVTEEHIRMASEKIEENKEVVALRSYPLHEKLLILAIMKSSEISTGEVYSTYKNLCKDIRQKELTQRRVTQMLSEIEMSGIISGRIVHQGTHGNTKKFRITVSPDMVKSTFKDEMILEDIL